MAVPDSAEHAWLALRSGVFALLDDGDPEAAAQLASEAVRIGQRARAPWIYEMVGRALHGFARVTAGQRRRRPAGAGRGQRRGARRRDARSAC